MQRVACCVSVILLLAGCDAPQSRNVQLALAEPTSDPALLEMFFGPGDQRAIARAIRCPVRCQDNAK